MKTIAIEAKRDFLERLATASPMKAIAELVWNGLDAGSNRIEIRFEKNKLDGLDKIRVRDFGTGIDHADVATQFGNLGASWKKTKQRFNGRSLHGKSGQGRFKAFALGNRVQWDTVFKKNGQAMKYQISGRADALDAIRFSEPINVNGQPVGTEVVVTDIDKSHGSLLSDTAHEELAKLFAAFLSQYPELKIDYDGITIDPQSLQLFNKDISLGDVELGNGKQAKVSVSIVEWRVPTKRVIHLCDANGVSLHETESGVQVRAPGFNFTAYIKSDHFRDLDKENLLLMDDLHPEVDAILKPAKQAIKAHFRRRMAEQQSQIVERWKKELIYPYVEKEQIDPVEEAERQVFDILAVNVESYLPAFEMADTKSRKFLFLLLAQALRENPESVQKIITEVLSLKKEEQADLAELLSQTPLSAIISSAKTVANRLDFVLALENLLFDKATKKKLLERDQLHKILENEAWIFNEEFALAGTEQRLEEVLDLHLSKLGDRADVSEPVKLEGAKTGRIDLLLNRATQPRRDEIDYLVVELKRPSQKINTAILNQIESYAIAVATDPRFLAQKSRWNFVVVGNDMDEHARRKTEQRDRPKGLVYDDAALNIKVWARTWSVVLADARTRLSFVNTQLSYEANRESSKKYLQAAHAKFLPVDGAETSDAEPETDGNKAEEAAKAQ